MDSNSILSAEIHPSQPDKVISTGVSGISSLWDLKKPKIPFFSCKPSNSINWKIQFLPYEQSKIVTCNENGELIYWKYENLNENNFLKTKDSTNFGINNFDIFDQYIAYVYDNGRVSISNLE